MKQSFRDVNLQSYKGRAYVKLSSVLQGGLSCRPECSPQWGTLCVRWGYVFPVVRGFSNNFSNESTSELDAMFKIIPGIQYRCCY